MKFHGIDNLGKIILENRATAPAFDAADEGRVYYSTVDKALAYNDGTSSDVIVGFLMEIVL
jgi:hypothetical protein